MQSNQIKQRHVTTNDNFYHWIYSYLNLNVQQRIKVCWNIYVCAGDTEKNSHKIGEAYISSHAESRQKNDYLHQVLILILTISWWGRCSICLIETEAVYRNHRVSDRDHNDGVLEGHSMFRLQQLLISPSVLNYLTINGMDKT